jgi:hypothetical protein
MIFQLAGGARASRDGRASVRHAQMRMGTTHFLMKTLPRVATEMPCIFWPTRLKSRPAASGSAVWGEPVAAAACSAWPLLTRTGLTADERVAGVGGTTLAVASMSYGYGPKSVIPATRLVVSHRHIWRRLLAGGTGLTPQPPRDAAQG